MGISEQRLLCLAILAAVARAAAESQGHFSGGTLSFSFINDTRVRIRSSLSWDLNFGPCGPGCDASRVGSSTTVSRALIYRSHGPYYFGKWALETHGNNVTDITSLVNREIKGVVSEVNGGLKFESEYGEFEVNLSPNVKEEDFVVEGNFWTPLSPLQAYGNSGKQISYHLQTRVNSGRRNDTGKPNNSPQAFFKPVYSIELNRVTEIKLAVIDTDGDVVNCLEAKFIEAGKVKSMEGISVQKANCSIFVNASESNGYVDNSTVAVIVKATDFNPKTITLSQAPSLIRYPFLLPMSAIPVQFLVRTTRILLEPNFVSPTPEDRQRFEVYVGSTLDVTLIAQPHVKSSLSVASISVICQQCKNVTLSALSSGLHTTKSRKITWDTSTSDPGTYILQASVVDTAGTEGETRHFIIELKESNLTKMKSSDSDDLHPLHGVFLCQHDSVCIIPLIFSSGQTIRQVALASPVQAGESLGPLRKTPTFRTTLTVNGARPGNHSYCVEVTGASSKLVVCVAVTIMFPNPCVNMPCKNGGHCYQEMDSYNCVCARAFTGRNCESEISYCEPNPCKQGRCISVPFTDQAYCLCGNRLC